MEAIKTRLRQFKLAGIYHSLEERLRYAQNNQLAYLEFLELLFEDELNNRKDNSYRKRYHKARFTCYKTLEDFDYNYQPSIDKRTINDCATCQFIAEKKNIVFIGNPGTGKTHLSIGIGIKALLKGYKVLFTTANEMLQALHFSKADNSFYKKLDYYLSFHLLIIDELGFKKLPSYSVGDFFEVIARRYEQGSIIITSNKNFQQWDDIFSDAALASAIVDRVVHHCITFIINGKSYRTKNLKQRRNAHN